MARGREKKIKKQPPGIRRADHRAGFHRPVQTTLGEPPTLCARIPVAQGKQEARAAQLLSHLAAGAHVVSFYGDTGETGSAGYCLSALYPGTQSGVCLLRFQPDGGGG